MSEVPRTRTAITLAECSQAIGIRTKMIANGNIPTVACSNLSDPADMARRELYLGMCPLKVKREYAGIVEYLPLSKAKLPPNFEEKFPLP